MKGKHINNKYLSKYPAMAFLLATLVSIDGAEPAAPFKKWPKVRLEQVGGAGQNLYVGRSLVYKVKYATEPVAGEEWKIKEKRDYNFTLASKGIYDPATGTHPTSVLCVPENTQIPSTTVYNANDDAIGIEHTLTVIATVYSEYVGDNQELSDGIAKPSGEAKFNVEFEPIEPPDSFE